MNEKRGDKDRSTLLCVLRISFLFICIALTTFPDRAYAQSIAFSFAQPSYSVSVSVDFATSDGSATAGVHYVATSGTLVFPVGVFSNAFIAGDNSVETDNGGTPFGVLGNQLRARHHHSNGAAPVRPINRWATFTSSFT